MTEIKSCPCLACITVLEADIDFIRAEVHEWELVKVNVDDYDIVQVMHYHLFVFANSDDEDPATELRRLHIILSREILLAKNCLYSRKWQCVYYSQRPNIREQV